MASSYLGNIPSNNFVSLKRQVITGNGGSTYTLDHSVASVNDVAIFVNNVRQDPASYSISGTALTLGGSISSSDSCYVIFLGQALQTVTPDTETVTGDMLTKPFNYDSGTLYLDDTNNRVGIGTTSPSRQFQVSATDAQISALSSTSSGSSAIHFGDSDDDNVGQVNYQHSDNSMRLTVNASERMRIDSSGHVGIGTTSPTHKLQVTGEFTGTSTGAALFQNTHSSVTSGDEVVRIQFSGDNDATGGHFVNFFDSGGDIGRINVNSASNIQYATTSDYRLKENIKDIENAIDKLKLLKPRNFNFIKKPDVSMDGFIAHELQDVVPIAVDGVKDQMRIVDGKEEIYPQAVDASKLIPILTKSLQEAITKIEELETRIQTLENN